MKKTTKALIRVSFQIPAHLESDFLSLFDLQAPYGVSMAQVAQACIEHGLPDALKAARKGRK